MADAQSPRPPSQLPRPADPFDRQIQLVQKYRTRLFADVVTGNLDVREAVARLPTKPMKKNR